ncbi:MAG: trypsin-like peptidase domain-containing protein [Armatimonadota bacterium]|nr:trypsin-like peptidase domain-containing protein [Armatimonadota bacterium]
MVRPLGPGRNGGRVPPGVLAAVGVLLIVTGGALALRATGAPTPQAILAQAAPAIAVVRATVDGRPVSGSAFVIDRDGWLLTAAHVVRRAAGIRVELSGRTPLEARLAGYDATRDLAVLRVPASDLPALSLAGRPPRVGEPVVAVAPRARADEVRAGQVVGTDVSVPGLARGAFLRVSIPARPGMSGGPLLNVRAEVVGVVVAFSVDASGRRGGLAVSVAAVRDVLPALRAGARVERAWLGVAGDPGARGPGPEGAAIRQVLPGTPAASAGLRPGDVIVEVDGAPVRSWDDLLVAIGDRRPGQRVQVVVVRGGQRVALAVTLGVRP